MKAILDISNLLHGAFRVNWDKNKSIEELENICRHIIIQTIYTKINDLKIRQKDMIIAVDSSSWRKEFFPYYKHKRKVSRDKSEIDVQLMFEFFDKLINELNDYFQFLVIKVDRCEADDIIGVLANHISVTENVVIISRDKDFLQLIDTKIKLFDPFSDSYVNEGKVKDHKMSITNKDEAKIYKLLHILIGDTTDGIMNVLSPDHILAFPKTIPNKNNTKNDTRKTKTAWLEKNRKGLF